MIRKFEERDIAACVSLGADMHAESRYAALDFDPDKLIRLGLGILQDDDTYFARVAEVDGRVVGLIVCYIIPHWFGNDLTSGDFAVYVAPEHRGSMIGHKMVKGYIAWAHSKGVKEPCIGVSAGITPDRIGALYKRLGFSDEYKIYKMPHNG